MIVETIKKIILEFPEYSWEFPSRYFSEVKQLARECSLGVWQETKGDTEIFRTVYVLGDPNKLRCICSQDWRSTCLLIYVNLRNGKPYQGGWCVKTDIGIEVSFPENFLDVNELAKGYICDKLYRFVACHYGENWPLIYKDLKIDICKSNGIQPIFKNKL